VIGQLAVFPFASVLLASAAPSQPIYPVGAVLSELKEVCFTDRRYSEERKGNLQPLSDAIGFWFDAAKNRGWQEISAGNISNSRELKVLHSIQILNSAISGSFVNLWTTQQDSPILGGQILQKSVSGRVIYLSIFGVDDGGGQTVGECRIHDPLGDGISKNPFTTTDIEKFAGGKVHRKAGPFSSDRYTWPYKRGSVSQVDIHFGFRGWRLTPFTEKIEQFDPYAPYGLTLVAGFHEHEIVG
jgi:hypothetical protein